MHTVHTRAPVTKGTRGPKRSHGGHGNQRETPRSHGKQRRKQWREASASHGKQRREAVGSDQNQWEAKAATPTTPATKSQTVRTCNKFGTRLQSNQSCSPSCLLRYFACPWRTLRLFCEKLQSCAPLGSYLGVGLDSGRRIQPSLGQCATLIMSKWSFEIHAAIRLYFWSQPSLFWGPTVFSLGPTVSIFGADHLYFWGRRCLFFCSSFPILTWINNLVFTLNSFSYLEILSASFLLSNECM